MRRLEHIGIAADDLERVLTVCRQVLGRVPYKTESVESEGVRTHFIDAGSAKLEFLECTRDGSPIATFLEKRGAGLHHLAFEVDDLDAEAARLSALGYRLLGSPRPGADGKRIIFLHPKDTAGVLVELCQQTDFPSDPGSGGTLAGSGDPHPVSSPGSFLVDAAERSNPLAFALSRYGRVVRGDGPDPRVRGAVAVDPSSDWVRTHQERETGMVVCTRPLEIAPSGGWLICGLDVDADVRFPLRLWEGLPDPWGTLAQLAAAHLA